MSPIEIASNHPVEGELCTIIAEWAIHADVADAETSPTPQGSTQTASAPPPSSEKYKPMFPRGAKAGGALPTVDEAGDAAESTLPPTVALLIVVAVE